MKSKNVILLIFINIVCIMIAASTIGMNKMSSSMMSYTKDWVKVDVRIDDISFKSNGTTTDDGNKIYKYIMNRTLKYTYNGIEYEVSDTEDYESKNSNYEVPLRTDYTDKYTYKINPNSPKSVSRSYSDMADGGELLHKIDKIVPVVLIIIPVVIDAIFLIKYFVKKRKVFE